MADPENQPSFAAATQEQESIWIPMAIGAALVVVVVLAFIFFSRSGTSNTSNRGDPYLAKLQVSNLHMATAENFAGGSVTYIQGTIANSGDKKVTNARVQVIFKNSLGETAQKDVLQVMVLLPNIPYVDYGALDHAPLAPGRSRDFRLTLEHVTADWDGQIPQLRVVSAAH
jgi:flagellar basal body-associated protein FliL